MKVSIITVVYNDVQHISETIESVINQDYNNIEYICIDGGSNDGTIDVINRYSKCMSYFISERDNGISDAFNKGIKQATGDFVLVLNSGDRYLTNTIISELMQLVKKNKIYVGKSIVYNNNLAVSFFDNNYMNLNRSMCISHSATLIPLTILKEVGFYDVNKKIAMDYDLLLKILNKYGFDMFESVELNITSYQLGGVSDNLFYKGFWESYLSKIKVNKSYFYGFLIFTLLTMNHFIRNKIK